jgi:hypothetical protein
VGKCPIKDDRDLLIQKMESANVEDLLLLESFQIKYLPDRVSYKEFSTLMYKYPFIRHFLKSKDPSAEDFIHSVLNENVKIKDEELVKEHCEELLWEIADLMVYNKYPEL